MPAARSDTTESYSPPGPLGETTTRRFIGIGCHATLEEDGSLHLHDRGAQEEAIAAGDLVCVVVPGEDEAQEATVAALAAPDHLTVASPLEKRDCDRFHWAVFRPRPSVAQKALQSETARCTIRLLYC